MRQSLTFTTATTTILTRCFIILTQIHKYAIYQENKEDAWARVVLARAEQFIKFNKVKSRSNKLTISIIQSSSKFFFFPSEYEGARGDL